MSSLPFEELKALLLLRELELRGAAGLISAEGFKPTALLESISEENFLDKAGKLRSLQARFHPDKEVEIADRLGCHFLTILDPAYPSLLKQTADPPLVLTVAGSFESTDEAAFAVVGSRHPSLYGLTQAQKFSTALAEAGLSIVSGFALGIDRAAHEAALKVRHGRTLAVIGCGLDVDYPKTSRTLFQKISEYGAVLSEYAFGTPPSAENFPKRNRIISGLSLGVLVVEAHRRSGSLITAHEAAEQGRDVFAIPGPVDRLTSAGCHLLIRKGAALVETPSDILENLEPWTQPILKQVCFNLKETTSAPSRASSEPLEEDESRLMDVLSGDSLGYEEICSAGAFDPARLAALVTRLELKGKIRRNVQGRFSKDSLL